jgi:hypothetical protein
MDDAARGRMRRRLRLAFKLHEAGVALMRRNLRRRPPDETEAGVDSRRRARLQPRPGAEHGAAAGRPVELPRPSR